MPTAGTLFHRIQSDEQGKLLIGCHRQRTFIANTLSHYIHLGDCCAAKRISPAHARNVYRPDEKHKICSRCRKRLLLTLGASEDLVPAAEYEDFFRRCGLPQAKIESLFLSHNAKMALLSLDTVMFRVGEDFWKIIIFDNNSLLLMHNNYIVKNGVRRFCDGFHPQHPPFSNAPEKAFRLMTSYSWESHIEGKRRKGRGKLKVQARDKVTFREKSADSIFEQRPRDVKKALKQKAKVNAPPPQPSREAAVKRSGPPPVWDEIPPTYKEAKPRLRKISKVDLC